MPLIVATYVCHASRLQCRTGSARTSLGPIYFQVVGIGKKPPFKLSLEVKKEDTIYVKGALELAGADESKEETDLITSE